MDGSFLPYRPICLTHGDLYITNMTIQIYAMWCLSMESKKTVNGDLLQHYSNEVCSHIEAAISLFFGLIGTLVILTLVETLAARTVFSLLYFVLGFLGTYFYIRLFYYRILLEGVLLTTPFRDCHSILEKRVFAASKLIGLTQSISRHEDGEYRLSWAWFMLAIAIMAAILSWVVVVFSL